MSKKIDFFIVGAQKSATTSIYEYLNSMESVAMPLIKEMQVFTNDKLYKNFPKNIGSFYAKDYEDKIVGMADVEILYAHKITAKKIYKHNNQAKIIIMLRNPIDRAYSSYWFSRKNQRETINTFEDAIAIEDERKKSLNQNDRLALTYLDVSMYFQQVQTFIEQFGKDNVLILTMEEFFKDKENEFTKVLKFLKLENESFNNDILSKKFNEGGDVKSKFLQSMFNRKNSIRSFYNTIIPLTLRMKIRNKVINPILLKNSKALKYQEIDKKLYEKLKLYFKDDIEALSKLIDKDLGKVWF